MARKRSSRGSTPIVSADDRADGRRLAPRGRAVRHRADGGGLGERLDVGLDGVDLGQRGEDLALDRLGDVVRRGEGQRARELQVERDLGAVARRRGR